MLHPPFEGFTLKSLDGSELEAAILKTSTPNPRGVVILCHPFVKYGMSYFAKNNWPQVLVDAGFQVVMFNFKGFGGSSIYGPTFSDDVVAAARWAKENFADLNVHLMGFSLGGYIGIHALVRSEGLIKSAVFDSVPPFIGNFFHKGLSGVSMRFLGRSRFRFLSGTAPICDSLSRIKGIPLLLIIGENDIYCSQVEFEALKSKGVFKFKVFPGAGHLEPQKIHSEEYRRCVTEFFQSN